MRPTFNREFEAGVPRIGMSTWAYRMHRGAATISNVVTSCGHTTVPYPTRMEKVKFGVPLDHVCKRDIPGPLLILILKLNKEAPCKKDVFRAPGHQGNMKKLIHFMQHGRLVNIDNFSVYTIASVLKKFLRKLPGGIFGAENEELLFDIIELDSLDEKRERIHRLAKLISSLPVVAQHLLVLLFGTFRSIAVSAERSQTGMTSEALGVSVAPSFFQSCVSDGKMAKMEDVVRFKVATRIMKFLIDNFGVSNLFGRENYEYYARITGRVLKIEEDWIFAFRYPPDSLVSRKASLETERSWLQQEAERWGLRFNLEAISSQEECQSTPALIHATESMIMEEGPETTGGSLANLGDYTRLSVSLEENGLYKSSSPPNPEMSLDELKAVNFYAESTKSLSFLPQVHERQTARMRTRSEWFLNPSPCPSPTPVCRLPVAVEVDEECGAGAAKVPRCERTKRTSGSSLVSCGSSNGHVGAFGNGVDRAERSTPTGSERQLVRRTSSKEKRLVRRSSSKSKQDKENGSEASISKGGSGVTTSSGNVGSPKAGDASVGSQSAVITEQDCTEVDVQTFHITLTYKPRI